MARSDGSEDCRRGEMVAGWFMMPRRLSLEASSGVRGFELHKLRRSAGRREREEVRRR